MPSQKDDADETSSIASEELSPASITPRWRVVTTYLFAATLAALLSFACPKSRMWNGGLEGEIQGVATLNHECLFELLLILFLVLASLACVQGSEPGYLTSEIVTGLFGDDGRGLLDGDSAGGGGTVEIELGTLTKDKKGNGDTTGDALQLNPAPPFTSMRRKFCDKCGFCPPLRAHHCRICNRCVATFDHHCIFIGTCIGERNQCRFWWFLTFQTLGFWTCSSIVTSSRYGVMDALESMAGVLVLFTKMYLYPLTLVSFVVWVAHTWFALSNMTSFECGKGPRHIDYLRGTQEFDLPFSQGCDGNLRLFCCFRDTACNALTGHKRWIPILWKPPGKIVRDSEDWWENPWQNKYYSCC